MTKIELFSDVVCPWCYLGAVRIERVLATVPHPVDLIYRPFLLQGDVPPEGIDIASMLRQRYGVAPAQAFARVEAAARDSELELDLRKQPRTYSSVMAHTLLRHAEFLGTQRALARALFVTHFDEAQNISDVEVLIPLAVAYGFNEAEARALLADEHERHQTLMMAEAAALTGIRAVPFYVFNGKTAISGAQPESVLRAAVGKAPHLG